MTNPPLTEERTYEHLQTIVAFETVMNMIVGALDSSEDYLNHSEAILDCYDAKIKEHLLALYRCFSFKELHSQLAFVQASEDLDAHFGFLELSGKSIKQLTWLEFRDYVRGVYATCYEDYDFVVGIMRALSDHYPTRAEAAETAVHAITNEGRSIL